MLCWILLTWGASLAFWVPSLREAYIYHFLPMYTFALVLLAGLLDHWYGKRPLGVLIRARGRSRGRALLRPVVG